MNVNEKESPTRADANREYNEYVAGWCDKQQVPLPSVQTVEKPVSDELDKVQSPQGETGKHGRFVPFPILLKSCA
jgi:hypothetical protein